MATLNVNYGTQTAFPNAGNINGLASNQSKAIGGVTNTTALAVGYKIDATFFLATTGVTSTGTITIYLVESVDGTNYTDGINITTTSDQTSSIKNAAVVKYVGQANANSQIVRIVFDLPNPLPPKFYSFLVNNGTGAAFSTTNNAVNYTQVTYTISP